MVWIAVAAIAAIAFLALFLSALLEAVRDVADEWDRTLYTIVTDDMVYEHCSRVTLRRNGVTFTHDGTRHVLMGVRYVAVREHMGEAGDGQKG